MVGNSGETPPARRHRRRRWVFAGIAVAVLAAVVAAGLLRRDEIVRYATHRKDGPAHTAAWTPFPPVERPELHLAVAGDVGHPGRRVQATGAAMDRVDDAEPFDGLVLTGDNVYPAGDPAGLRGTVFRPFSGVLDRAPLFAVLGNHDIRDGNGPRQVAALGMPGRWWAHDFGDVLLIGLDSNRPRDPRQRAWLAATLAHASERWRIVVLHHPPYSAGYHGSDTEVRHAFVPFFERYGVELVVSGHDHDYQRSVPLDGVTYLVTGAASETRRTGEESFTADSFSWHHFVELAVFDDRIVVRAIGQNGRVADEATVGPPATVP